VNVQFPGPVQRFVQVLPALQMNVQPPPLHDVSHVAPSSHVMVQSPPLHDGMHDVPLSQSNVHDPAKQPGAQLPEVHVHEPSDPQPVDASAESAASLASVAFASSLAESFDPLASLVGLASVVPESFSGVPESFAAGDVSHAETASASATNVIAIASVFIESRCNRIAPSSFGGAASPFRPCRGSS
jgi:hypothetical protein